MKKLLIAALSLSLLGASVLPALAADHEPSTLLSPAPITAPVPAPKADPAGLPIQVNGQVLDVKANIMVPLRAVAEKLGFTVTWDQGVVTVTGSERYLEFTLGKDEYFAAPTQEGIMGASFFSLGCAPYSVNGSAYVPLELFDALLGSREGVITVQNGRIQMNTDPAAANSTQIPNPFTDQDSLEQATKAAGFDLTVPEDVNGSPRHSIQTLGDQMIQVFYGDADHAVCIRKAPGSEDISGDYSVYTQTNTAAVNGASVTTKGENDLIYLALWTNDGYTYSISARSGMRDADMIALIRLIH